MAYCPKCGTKVGEEMSFCPKCGAPIKAAQPAPEAVPVPARRRDEKSEKQEKQEKGEKEGQEKGEKHEKREMGFLGPLVGGVILLLIGLLAYLQVTGLFEPRISAAIFFVIIGVIIIVAAVYGTMAASRRHPRT